jgi:ADP-ribosylglycohydrolase
MKTTVKLSWFLTYVLFLHLFLAQSTAFVNHSHTHQDMVFRKLFASSSSSTSGNAALPVPETTIVQQRLRQALWAFFAGDALSSPSHWFYGGPRQIQQQYGALLTDYTKPTEQLPGSILNKSNLLGAGRSKGGMQRRSDDDLPPTIVGHVILHGKQDYWHPSKQIHYHATLQAGENTLEASLARVLMRSIVENEGRFDANHFRQAYMNFMMTPGSHNDTYASTCHRMFFSNLIYDKKQPEDCPDNDSHNVDTIDGLILPTLVSLAVAAQPSTTAEDAAREAQQCVAVTRRSKPLQTATAVWAGLVYSVIRREKEETNLTKTVEAMAKSLGLPQPKVRPTENTMTACYLDSSLPAALDNLVTFDSQKRNGDVSEVWRDLLAIANTGGENVHRASCIGAILGANSDLQPEAWSNSRLVQGLYHHDALQKEIENFVAAVTS